MLLRNTGAALSPFNAFLFLQGIETLPLRMERHYAERAGGRRAPRRRTTASSWVNYPGLESSPYHEVAEPHPARRLRRRSSPSASRAAATAGRTFIESLELFSHLANIGDAKSLAIHNASTTHSQLNEEELAAAGVTQDTVRLSVGIEHIDDILDDLDQALAKRGRSPVAA